MWDTLLQRKIDQNNPLKGLKHIEFPDGDTYSGPPTFESPEFQPEICQDRKEVQIERKAKLKNQEKTLEQKQPQSVGNDDDETILMSIIDKIEREIERFKNDLSDAGFL